MKKVTPEQVEKWLAQGERLMKSPITAAVFGAIAPFLPKAGLTEKQIAGMKARSADAAAREARARDRAT